MALAKSIKKVGVVVGNGYGFVGNRLVIPYMNEAQFLVEEGATPEQVDRVLTDFGMAMGPFAVADLSGLDVFWRIRQEKPHVPGARETLGLPTLYELGRYGQKTGAGWFKYGEDRKAAADPEVVELVHRTAREAGVVQRAISDTEILDRCIFALVNEGAKVLDEGIASRASDIDVVYLTGYGFLPTAEVRCFTPTPSACRMCSLGCASSGGSPQRSWNDWSLRASGLLLSLNSTHHRRTRQFPERVSPHPTRCGIR